MDRNDARSFFDKVKKFGSALFSRLSKLFDKVVYHKTSSVIVSLLVSIGICVAVNFDDIRYTFFNSDMTTLNLPGVPVEVKADMDTYEISGIPSTVDLTLTGDPADIQSFRNQSSNAVVVADLRSLRKATMSFRCRPAMCRARSKCRSIRPRSMWIWKKITKSFPVDAELLIGVGQKRSDFDTTTPAQTSVQIKATLEKLQSIRKVEAIVDTTGKSADFTINAPLVAYDANGSKVDAQITPASVEVSVTVKTNSN